MASTTPLGFPYPVDSDYPSGADVPLAVLNLATAIDTFMTGKYALISIRYITSGVTFTPTTGVDALYVECIGGGGAGGGAATGATNGAAGGGGGGGAYSAKWTTTMKSPFTIAIGAAGVGSSGADGGSGGDTTFDSPSICTAVAGIGGKVSTVTAPPAIGGLGGGGGASGVGDLLGAGQPGGWGIMLAAAQVVSGNGGGSVWGKGGLAIKNATSSGAPGAGYGGGGSGAAIISGGGSGVGGSGIVGVIRVWEFKKGGL